MFDTLEQLDLEDFLLCLHDIDRTISELVWKGVVDFGARQEEWIYSRTQYYVVFANEAIAYS